MTTNQQLDALIRRVDVAWQPDPGFVEASRTSLMNQVRASRAADQSWLGGLDSQDPTSGLCGGRIGVGEVGRPRSAPRHRDPGRAVDRRRTAHRLRRATAC